MLLENVAFFFKFETGEKWFLRWNLRFYFLIIVASKLYPTNILTHERSQFAFYRNQVVISSENQLTISRVTLTCVDSCSTTRKNRHGELSNYYFFQTCRSLCHQTNFIFKVRYLISILYTFGCLMFSVGIK